VTKPASRTTDLPTRLNVGCGRDVRGDWVNLDHVRQQGMDRFDIVGDICEPPTVAVWDQGHRMVRPHDFEKHFTEMELCHVIEHLPDVLVAMDNLYIMAATGCVMTVRCPHGASDDADEDPTHVRRMFPSSFLTFGQPYYWRSDYGYRGDWVLDEVVCKVSPYLASLKAETPQAWADLAHKHAQAGRNMVLEMTATLKANRPGRKPRQELMEELRVAYQP